MLAIVQFSSIAEDGRRGLPATQSLRTKQRVGKGTGPCAIESGRHFRIVAGRRVAADGLPGPRRRNGGNVEAP